MTLYDSDNLLTAHTMSPYSLFYFLFSLKCFAFPTSLPSGALQWARTPEVGPTTAQASLATHTEPGAPRGNAFTHTGLSKDYYSSVGLNSLKT